MNPQLHGTHLLLFSWGNWGKGPHLGLPTMSPMFGERALKTPMYSFESPNPEVALVDKAICQLEPNYRTVIIRKYGSRWTIREFMREYRWGAGKVYRECEKAVMQVHVRINGQLQSGTAGGISVSD